MPQVVVVLVVVEMVAIAHGYLEVMTERELFVVECETMKMRMKEFEE